VVVRISQYVRAGLGLGFHGMRDSLGPFWENVSDQGVEQVLTGVEVVVDTCSSEACTLRDFLHVGYVAGVFENRVRDVEQQSLLVAAMFRDRRRSDTGHRGCLPPTTRVSGRNLHQGE